jgi:hypothetical protein
MARLPEYDLEGCPPSGRDRMQKALAEAAIGISQQTREPHRGGCVRASDRTHSAGESARLNGQRGHMRSERGPAGQIR